MKKLMLALVAMFSCAIVFAGDLVISTPDKGPTCEYKIAKLTANGYAEKSALLWRYDKTKLDGGKVTPDGKTVWLVGAPGTYLIELIAIKLDSTGQTVVDETSYNLVIERPVPPTPPAPPAPALPQTALGTDLQAAYTAETSPAKASYKAKLSAIFKQAVTVVDSTDLKTMGDIQNVLVTSLKAILPAGVMTGVRQRIATELATLGTTATDALTADKKAAAKALFTTIANTLDGVK